MSKRSIAILLALAAAVFFVVAGIRFWQERTAGARYDELRDAAVIRETPEPAAPTATPEATPEPVVSEEAAAEPEAEPIPIDFEALRKECPDAYAWIRIPNTQVDYPIVQRVGDDAFYLTHAADGSEDRAGAIYTESSVNNMDFSDRHTVIYGHNMKNGSMFQSLHLFEDRAFFEDNTEFEIYLPKKVLHYRVIAAYNTDDKHLLKGVDIEDDSYYRSYLQTIQTIKGMNAFAREGITLTTNDKILTLSTCNVNSEERYLVQAVLQQE